jgi:hypothetical protein
MKMSEYLDLAEKYVKSVENKAEIDTPKLPSQFEKLPYVRHFGPLHSKSKDLNSDINTTCMFPLGVDISSLNYLFVGLPKTKVFISANFFHRFNFE